MVSGDTSTLWYSSRRETVWYGMDLGCLVLLATSRDILVCREIPHPYRDCNTGPGYSAIP
eukprot:scaffold5108_cov172-Amphora_coffeaeformis.AAC.16